MVVGLKLKITYYEAIIKAAPYENEGDLISH